MKIYFHFDRTNHLYDFYIVTADIHQGLYRPARIPKNADHQYLTFWHWSGVTPYTSSYEFAGSCVFDKQSPGILSLRPPHRREALSRSYGRFFAEFLEEQSLVRLGLLDLTTCVGLRYGLHMLILRDFSWKRALQSFPARRRNSPYRLECVLPGFS